VNVVIKRQSSATVRDLEEGCDCHFLKNNTASQRYFNNNNNNNNIHVSSTLSFTPWLVIRRNTPPIFHSTDYLVFHSVFSSFTHPSRSNPPWQSISRHSL
jgi:hypothetical protein